jgi:hypothetical protein
MVEITRSLATRRAIRQVPGLSPASTSWRATKASSASASACSSPNSRSVTAASTASASPTNSDTNACLASGRPRHTRACPAGRSRAHPLQPRSPWGAAAGPAGSPRPAGRWCPGWRPHPQGSWSPAPAGVAQQAPGGLHDLADRLKDPPWPGRAADAASPVRQDCGMEALVVQAQPAGDLPGDVAPQRACRLAVAQALQRLQHHDAGDHLGGHLGGHRRVPAAWRATSANSSGGNNSWRWSASNAYNDRSGTRWRHQVAASISSSEAWRAGLIGGRPVGVAWSRSRRGRPRAARTRARPATSRRRRALGPAGRGAPGPGRAPRARAGRP